MSEHYNQQYTQEEVDVVLDQIKNYVNSNRFTVSLNEYRKESIQFINDYRLDKEKQKKILLSIEAIDFCHSLNNTNSSYEHEILYVFCPRRTLFNVLDQ